MSFPRYPAYKDSGVAWLGEVPEHWDVMPLRRLIHEVSSGTSVNAIDEPAAPGQAGVLKTSCVYTGDFRPEENKAIIESELDRANCSIVAGCLIVSRMNTPDLVGAAGLVRSNNPLLFLPDRLWQVRFKDCDPQFMNYWCKSASYRSQVQLACSGTSSSMQNLSQDNFYSFIAPLPAAAEQSAIATFLDRETAKIDALIAEQQRLIELLQEKRQAVISQAVTKGLNPDAPMKDSGVEWLGEVPVHWTAPLLFLRYEALLGKMVDEKRATGAYPLPYLRNADVYWDAINTDGLPTLDIQPHERLRYTIRRGDVLICEGGAGIGQTAIWQGDDDCIAFQKALHRLRPWNTEEEEPRYLFYCMRLVVDSGILLAGGTATIPHLTGEQLRRYRFPCPPLQEQRAIVRYLDCLNQELDALLDSSAAAITLLQERRSTLISAAVTGQIDVRGLVAEAEVA